MIVWFLRISASLPEPGLIVLGPLSGHQNFGSPVRVILTCNQAWSMCVVHGPGPQSKCGIRYVNVCFRQTKAETVELTKDQFTLVLQFLLRFLRAIFFWCMWTSRWSYECSQYMCYNSFTSESHQIVSDQPMFWSDMIRHLIILNRDIVSCQY